MVEVEPDAGTGFGRAVCSAHSIGNITGACHVKADPLLAAFSVSFASEAGRVFRVRVDAHRARVAQGALGTRARGS